MSDLEVVWDGNVRSPMRGHLAMVPETLRPAPHISRESPSNATRGLRHSGCRAKLTERLAQGVATHAELCTYTGLKKDSLSHLLSELRKDGLLVETPISGAKANLGQGLKIYGLAKASV